MMAEDLQSMSGRSYELDSRGFLADPGVWGREFVEAMAPRLGMASLTLQHWKVILFVRKHYERTGGVPRLCTTCHQCGVSLSTIRHLFPPGYQRGVCRLAGLPYEFLATVHPALTYEAASPRAMVYPVSPTGFITDSSLWDAEFSRLGVGGAGGDEPGPDHWEVLRFVREQVATTGRLPCLVRICRHLGLSLQEWDQLFPDGYRQGPWRLAGIPARVT